MSFRLAAYAVCIDDGRVLLARYVSPKGEGTWWTLPGGRVEHAEDPYDAVTREVAEETGCSSVVERLLGVDSRLISAAESTNGTLHQNVGVFYAVRITGGSLRPEPNGETAESVWSPLSDIAGLSRSVVIDVGVGLAMAAPSTGHLASVAVGGLVRH
ncbi:NUDIX domain-containing protein [Kribbella sp. NPDC051718]|uniref:NUDIX domain-containing protein n=1 Tax=Kribbella sp. NPDC051718 TaxID=3155168 RepID=UPI0034278010